MKTFHCSHCQQLVFFENTRCVKCEHSLAYLPDLADMGTLELAGSNVWRSAATGERGRNYRMCENYSRWDTCNWAVPVHDPNPLCSSCRLTRTIPDLNQPGHSVAWFRVESAKRRLVYSLMALELPLLTKSDDPKRGLCFDFLADGAGESTPVLTGHNDGVITVNVAEADDVERERRRQQMHEPYRTLLGHFRHEVGHYYWDRLIKFSEQISAFRALFGDEREDYGQALKRHYDQGAPRDWQARFVTAYASAHAWEDWAETWAHYLHIVDTLETATTSGLALQPRRSDEPALRPGVVLQNGGTAEFEAIIEQWFPLTYVLNNLNRGLGLLDAYPFVLHPVAIEKLRFVHETIRAGSDRKI